MVNTIITFLILLCFFSSTCNKNETYKKSDVDNKSIRKNELSQDPFETKCSTGSCSTFVRLNNGKHIFAGEYPKEPSITFINKNIAQILLSCGSPCNYTTYIDLENGLKSKPFFLVVAVDSLGRYVAYCSQKGLCIAPIFDSSMKPLVITRDYSPAVSVFTVVDSVSFHIGDKLVFKYLSGKDQNNKWDTVDFKFGSSGFRVGRPYRMWCKSHKQTCLNQNAISL